MRVYGIKDLLRTVLQLTLCRLACAGVRTTACGGNPADVVFVLDSSSSIWDPDFHRQLTFVQDMVDIFPIAPNLTRVALVTFSTRPQVVFYFNTFKSKARLMRRIGQVSRDTHMHTATDKALRDIRRIIRKPRFGARHDDPGVTQVAIVITDGRSDNTTATGLEAAKAREQGIHIFAIGVGDQVDQAELQSIASPPWTQYVHRVHNYEGLNSIKELLAIKTCTVTDPPTSPPPITSPITTPSTTTPITTPTTTPLPTTTPKPTTKPTPTPTRTPTTNTPVATTTPTTPNTTSVPTPITTAAPSTVAPSQSTPPQFGVDGDGVKKIHHEPSPPTSTEEPELPPLLPDEEFTAEFTEVERENEIDPDPTDPTKHPPPPASLFLQPFDPDGLNRVCTFDEPTDIVFVIDEKKGGPETMTSIWKFIKDLLNYVDMSNGNVNVKFIYECVDIPNVQLGSYNNKTALLSALSSLLRHPRTTADLLQHMSYRLLGSDINSIEPHHKIGVYITDGPSGNISATLNEAQTAKLLHNIELFGVGIGKDIDPTELRALVSCEVDKHLHMVIKPRDLDDVVHPVIKELCKVRRHHSRYTGL